VADLVFTAITSLDGYIEDSAGDFGWAAPDEEVYAFVNDLERRVGTHLLGRRMYETMVYWEDPPPLDAEPPCVREFAELWRAADKVVFSTTLDGVSSARSRIERRFDPQAIRTMKSSSERELSVGGPDLAAEALRAGLVDEVRLFLTPIVVGGGKPVLPADLRVRTELLDERRFAGGVVYLRYALPGGGPSDP
jgi:dihydrofolate reductase